MQGLASLAFAGWVAVVEPAPATIVWAAPAGCPDTAELTAMITALLRPGSAERDRLGGFSQVLSLEFETADQIYIADFNGDGTIDLAIADHATGSVSWSPSTP